MFFRIKIIVIIWYWHLGNKNLGMEVGFNFLNLYLKVRKNDKIGFTCFPGGTQGSQTNQHKIKIQNHTKFVFKKPQQAKPQRKQFTQALQIYEVYCTCT